MSWDPVGPGDSSVKQAGSRKPLSLSANGVEAGRVKEAAGAKTWEAPCGCPTDTGEFLLKAARGH